ncbi:helix-turn-helix transcriptional regulator, partial [Edaphosphingomonas haloaromaticamans]|uniref:helix-turn-helix transcriptional regulator n=1 Tax=Edaphosphingomonas haloaromaticamans TaxID=653954 RepID=UPI0020C7B8F7
FDILAHHRSSQKAAISTAEQLPARRPSEHGYAISIAEIAHLCRLSLSYFVRAFSNTVGIAPYAWFVQQRISRAKRLLTGTSLPLAQIALECGFSDQAHFTNAFVKATETTPARWRREALAHRQAA